MVDNTLLDVNFSIDCVSEVLSCIVQEHFTSIKKLPIDSNDNKLERYATGISLEKKHCFSEAGMNSLKTSIVNSLAQINFTPIYYEIVVEEKSENGTDYVIVSLLFWKITEK